MDNGGGGGLRRCRLPEAMVGGVDRDRGFGVGKGGGLRVGERPGVRARGLRVCFDCVQGKCRSEYVPIKAN